MALLGKETKSHCLLWTSIRLDLSQNWCHFSWEHRLREVKPLAQSGAGSAEELEFELQLPDSKILNRLEVCLWPYEDHLCGSQLPMCTGHGDMERMKRVKIIIMTHMMGLLGKLTTPNCYPKTDIFWGTVQNHVFFNKIDFWRFEPFTEHLRTAYLLDTFRKIKPTETRESPISNFLWNGSFISKDQAHFSRTTILLRLISARITISSFQLYKLYYKFIMRKIVTWVVPTIACSKIPSRMSAKTLHFLHVTTLLAKEENNGEAKKKGKRQAQKG